MYWRGVNVVVCSAGGDFGGFVVVVVVVVVAVVHLRSLVRVHTTGWSTSGGIERTKAGKKSKNCQRLPLAIRRQHSGPPPLPLLTLSSPIFPFLI